ncbi:MAG: NAD(P)-dependent oxidoreductase [Aquabacterium sp.]|uniref:SDR family oxidoreductase n=1 Tax=Aquabacterium sp. TaxID=1872578 RepID=UPI0025BBFE77|nr:NAD(P)-dependent oxidoreductase [Aquabacterium sp.]MBI5924077.1 NAD(P)-dependent oxidoreductase [Aquabacterium sp.]
MTSLAGKTLFITGASRGIGKAIALRAARDGANIVVAAKTSEPDPRLPGTIHSAAAEIEAAGGRALPLVLDVRDEDQVRDVVAKAAAHFGGIDILINNASAINLTKTPEVAAKRYDLMMDINVRGTFMCSQACLPFLEKAANPHILVLSPPINLQEKWFESHAAYTVSKYSMSTVAFGLAAELRSKGIAVNALWPRTLIATSALNVAGSQLGTLGRTPDIMADAAYRILTRASRDVTGQFFIDEQVLRDAGVTDFDRYLVTPGSTPMLDLYVDE